MKYAITGFALGLNVALSTFMFFSALAANSLFLVPALVTLWCCASVAGFVSWFVGRDT